MSRVSLPIAILVPTPVAVKNAGTPAPAARMRSASVPCGTISNSILPARYSVSNTTGSEDRGKEQMILATRPSSIRCARPTWPTPALLQATVRLVAPCSISPSISAFGWPTAPKPPTSTVAPSSMPAMASAMDWTILLIMLGASFGHAASFGGNVASWPDTSQERLSGGLLLARAPSGMQHGTPGKTSRGHHDGTGVVGDRGRAREPADRRLAAPRRGVVPARADLRRLRPEFGRVGGAVADPRVAPAAVQFHAGV